ncbi:alpha-L-rhamnosidase [Terrimonas pollutisoli]|uniref:alpha-L-rhamnosidase n=1 Tax=Terrimonas pollutisoli TaxID=3034147 RepID=UPI0023EB07F0|nr:alpha-L-rhamnosidase [Terrimonas sp. H1YJ31]
MRQYIIILTCLFSSLQPIAAQVTVQRPRCEMLNNPLGIDVTSPRLSWQLQSTERNVEQTAYHILVASSKEKLNSNEGDLWNSGKISSSQSIHISYIGQPLQSGQPYFWKVKSFTTKGETPWSEMAYWSTGLLNESDWKAKWIGYDKASKWDSVTQWSRLSARYLCKEFQNAASVKRATAYISGLGMYELYINGKKIGDQVLAPNPTDYRKTYFYNTHDVTTQIKTGRNAIGAVLGNGRFFTMRQNYKTHKHNTFGYPKLLLQLEIEYTDGSKKIIISDESWKLNVDGPIRTNNEYDGEEYDARKEFSGWTIAGFADIKWIQPQIVEAPKGKMIAQMSEPMKVMQTIKPVSLKKLPSGKYILDMGQNFSGWLKLQNINGKKGEKIELRFAESLQKNGELFVANLRDAKVTDIYTFGNSPLGAGGWHPSFVYHGFRYVEVSGFPGVPTLDNFEGQLVYDALETTGSFETSSSTVNAIYKNAWWGIASNYKGMPIDCPQRNERQPWLGDRTVGSQGESYVFNNAALYAKWMQDIEDSQTEEGSIPDVAPAFWNYYSDDVTWPAAYIFISNNLYNQFGDITPIQKHYPSMKKWMMYMKEKYMKNYIVTRDKYGDWCVPPESLELIHAKDPSRLTDGKLIATAYYYKLLSYMQRFAQLTNNKEDEIVFAALGDSIRTSFQKAFYNPQQQSYSNNTVTANLLPLYFGICPDSLREVVFEKIKHKIEVDNKNHISTGLIGSQWLMRGLTEYNHTDLAFTLASNTTYPSWGYMAANGATTIWELWNGNTANPGMNSQNHVMLLGDLLTWFYENLAGIRSNKIGVGFKKIIMKPSIPAGLNYVNASYKSLHGLIVSNWKKIANQFEWSVSIPANTKAMVYLPADDVAFVKESGQPIQQISDIKFIKMEKGSAVFEIGSGSYHFQSQSPAIFGIYKEEEKKKTSNQ